MLEKVYAGSGVRDSVATGTAALLVVEDGGERAAGSFVVDGVGTRGADGAAGEGFAEGSCYAL